MPGEGGAAGLGGCAIGGVTGLAAFGMAGAAGLGAGAGADAAAGFAAIFGLLAGALRAAGLRAAALRAGFLAAVLRAEVLRAVARLAPVFAAPVLRFALAVFRAVLRVVRAVLRAVLRVVRAVFRAALRGLVFLLVVRFFPLVLVAMVCAPFLLLMPRRPLKRTLARITASLVQACRLTRRVNRFFHYTMIADESGNLGARRFNGAASITPRPH